MAVHIYTQTIHRTTQITNNVEECDPRPVFASFTLAFALQLRKKHGKTSVRVRKTSVRLIKTKVRVQHTYYQNTHTLTTITPQCAYTALHWTCWIRNMWTMGAEDVLKQTAGNRLPYSLVQLGTAATATVASVANDEELWPLPFHTHKCDTVLVKFN